VSDYAPELAVALEAARVAGAVLRRHYAAGSIAVDTKSDRSPVTAADRDANDAIVAILRRAFPEDGLLTEESPDDGTRLGRSRVWIVDPLDGTRDFVARTDDFCVHVALAVDGVPTVGVVHQVVPGLTYLAVRGQGAFVEDDDATAAGQPTRTPVGVSSTARADDVRVGTSRLNLNAALWLALQATGLAARAVALGASVKLMAVARGELDAVVSFSSAEMEWDTCAPEVIIREAGGRVTDLGGDPLRYNQPDPARRRGSLASNGACHQAIRELVRRHFEDAGRT
jgi:3'(2'), 5'-bisphosphate nucleotidase